MGSQAVQGLIAIVTGIVVLAIIGVLVSNGSNTSSIITGAGSALSGVLKAAMPSSSGNTSLPGLLPL
jgi:cell shape-determining protein MreC